VAEEAVQETWIAIIEGLDRFEGRSSLATWVFRIMLNKVRRSAARERRAIPFAAAGPYAEPVGGAVDPQRLRHPELGPNFWTEAPPRWDELPEARLLNSETREVLVTAIGQLPAAQREVLTLREIAGLSSAEVSEALGISLVNQRVLLHRARAALRQALEEFFRER
jgi:RNA polymerase sigma-70 factor, ECF subfamily